MSCILPSSQHCVSGCCEYYVVAGAEAVQPGSMGTFAKVGGLTSSNLPVYRNSDGMYLYYGATGYGFTAWGIGPSYSGIGQRVVANAGGAVCPAAATGYQASTANGGWTSYDMSVSCIQGCDASTAPSHGGVGNCTPSLAPGSICQPTCNTGYRVSGASSCSGGVLSAATCIGGACV